MSDLIIKPSGTSANFKVQNPSGTDKIVMNSSGVMTTLPPGMVIEEFMSPCDGSSITVQSGTYTVGTVSAAQSLSQSYADITGSSIDYTPPTGTQTVIYTFSLHWTYDDDDAYNMASFKLFLDNDSGTATEVTNFRTQLAGQAYIEGRYTFVWAFHIGGSTTAATGRVATWTSARTIKMQSREYYSSNESQLHTTNNWDDTGSNQFSQPVIGIKALA